MNRVMCCEGSVELLDACGFKDQGAACKMLYALPVVLQRLLVPKHVTVVGRWHIVGCKTMGCRAAPPGEVLAIEGQPDGFVLSQAQKFLDLLIGQLRN